MLELAIKLDIDFLGSQYFLVKWQTLGHNKQSQMMLSDGVADYVTFSIAYSL